MNVMTSGGYSTFRTRLRARIPSITPWRAKARFSVRFTDSLRAVGVLLAVMAGMAFASPSAWGDSLTSGTFQNLTLAGPLSLSSPATNHCPALAGDFFLSSTSPISQKGV